MVSYILKSIQNLLENRNEAAKRLQYEENLKLQELMKELNRDDENENETANRVETPVAKTETDKKLDCSKVEGMLIKFSLYRIIKQQFISGLITSLTKEGGEINNRHKFMKYVAKNDWGRLEVGSKVSFLLFEGCVCSVEKIDPDWDEALAPVEEETSIGYSTDYRTIIGSVTSVQDGILVVETGGSQELHIPLEDHPDLKLFFIVGDVVSSQAFQNDI